MIISPPHSPQAKLAGQRPVIAQCRQEDGWRLTPATLKEALASSPARKILILTNPGNPSERRRVGVGIIRKIFIFVYLYFA